MTWTRLDFEPKDPVVAGRRPGDRPPGDMQAMNALGGLSKVAAALLGKQPEDELVPRGFLGVELAAVAGDAGGVRVARVLPGSAAATAGVRDGDRIVRVDGREVTGLKDARGAVAGVKSGDRVELGVRRGGREGAVLSLSVTAGEGF